MKDIQLLSPVPEEFPRLLEIWEASARATHHFLREEDIQLCKSLIIEKELFKHCPLTCAYMPDNSIAGFVGVAENAVDMLFLDPAYINKGIGGLLLRHAIELGARKVDVNEENIQAVGFYERYGFVIVSRSDLDDFGNPFPIVRMELRG